MKVVLNIEPQAGLYLVALSGVTPPTEFKVFPFGTIETDKGTFKFDEEGAKLVMADRARRTARVQIDYDHLAIKSEKPGDGKAAGWCDLEIRKDGLWAVNVEWTPTAAKMIADKEYGSISPFFGATKKDKRIVILMNIAITNLPATHESTSLIAAARAFGYDVEVELVECVIKHEGGKWKLYDSEGKKLLGTHDTEEDAKKQESAINISKAREAGHRIPKPEATRKMAHKLGGYMAARLKKDGMSLKALSEKCGLSEERCRALHDGEDPSPEEMKALAKGFGMKDDEFKETVDAHRMSSFDDAGEDGDDDEEDKEDKKAVAAAQKRIEQREAKRKGKKKPERTEDTETDLTLVELAQTTDKKQQLQFLKELATAAKELVPLRKKFEENEKVMLEQKREALIQKGKQDGKLTPSLIRYWASRSVSEFEEALKAMPVLSTASLDLREGESSAAAAVLTHEEIEVCRLSNSSPEVLADFVKNEKSGKNERDILNSYYAPAK